MPAVRAKENEHFESVWRRFRRLVEKANILSELRKRAHHEKAAAKRKRSKLAAKKREQKRTYRETQMLEREVSRVRSVDIDLDLLD